MPNGCRGEARCSGACSCTPPGRPGGDRTAKEQELPPLDRHAQKTTHPLPSRRTHAARNVRTRTDRLATLKRGTQLTIVGQIKNIRPLGLSLGAKGKAAIYGLRLAGDLRYPECSTAPRQNSASSPNWRRQCSAQNPISGVSKQGARVKSCRTSPPSHRHRLLQRMAATRVRSSPSLDFTERAALQVLDPRPATARSVRAGPRRSRNSPAVRLWPVAPHGAAPHRPGWAGPG